MNSGRSEDISAPPDAGGHLGSATRPEDLRAAELDTGQRPEDGAPQAPALSRPVGSMDKGNGSLDSTGLGSFVSASRKMEPDLTRTPMVRVLELEDTPLNIVLQIAAVAVALVLAIALASLVF